jgi:muramoyltetrapeptide carboxypeptidase
VNLYEYSVMDSAASRRHFLQLASLGLTVPMLSARVSTARQAKTIIKPPILRSGDTIGLIAPSGNASGREEIQTAKENMEKYGFKVELGKHINAQKGYLAGTDEERAADVNDMFRRPEIRGIATFLGGYGCCRILPFLDYNLIRSHPKVLVGYSDITSFLLAIHQKTGLVTFHGSSGLTKVGDYSRMHFRQTIMSSSRIGEVAKPSKASEGTTDSNNRLMTIVPGKVTGPLIGGNLTLVTNLLGTPYEPDTRGKILFLEEVGEESYRVDRMLTQLWLAGKLQDAAGFALGRFVDCESKDYPPSSPQTLSLETVLRDRFVPLRKPTLYNLMFGHIEENAVLPIGIMATLNATEQTLTINENAVV